MIADVLIIIDNKQRKGRHLCSIGIGHGKVLQNILERL